MSSATEEKLHVYDRLYIAGQWTAPSGDGMIEVVNAFSEEVMGSVPAGDAQDVQRAVGAARQALPLWSAIAPSERAEWLGRIAAGLAARGEQLAALIAQELGMPFKLSQLIQAGLPTATFASMAQIVSEVAWEETIGNSLILREPAGVVGAITPWNYPLHQIAAKVAPALAAGCTIVLKPAGIAPLNAFVLAEVIHEVGLPAGVFNLVSGPGGAVGEAIAAHGDVDMISFTGSTAVGRRVSEIAAHTVKRVALELGGKSANVILDDAPLAQAVPDGVAKCFLNSGQTCSALTRMLVPRSQLAQVEELALAAASAYTPGDPLDPQTRMGPLVSADQQRIVRDYIAKGVAEGAKLICGGAEMPPGVDHGYFVAPTIFSDVTPAMTIAREEIFGPVLSIMPYEDEQDAVRIANDSEYGLAGGVWSQDAERAKRLARRLRTGQVEINGGAFNALAPFGGYKQSGHGRELGRFGLEEFCEIKSLQL